MTSLSSTLEQTSVVVPRNDVCRAEPNIASFNGRFLSLKSRLSSIITIVRGETLFKCSPLTENRALFNGISHPLLALQSKFYGNTAELIIKFAVIHCIFLSMKCSLCYDGDGDGTVEAL